MTKFFKKSKRFSFVAILGPFSQFGKKWIFLEKGCQFLNIPIIYNHAKNQKKMISHSWENCPTARQTDGQRWFYGTLRGMGNQKNSNLIQSCAKIKIFAVLWCPLKTLKILESNQYWTSETVPSIIYADLESLIKKVDGCKNNTVESSATKIDAHIPCGYLISTNWTFDGIENKHYLYRGEDCMKKFCEALREHEMKTINF